MIYEAGSGHPWSSLSAVVTTLYFDKMKVDPSNPKWENRDRFIASPEQVSVSYLCELLILLAERVGFEPTLELPLNTLSKRAPSATRPSLRGATQERATAA
jgi:transketolase